MATSRAFVLVKVAIILVSAIAVAACNAPVESRCTGGVKFNLKDGGSLHLSGSEYNLEPNKVGYYLCIENSRKRADLQYSVVLGITFCTLDTLRIAKPLLSTNAEQPTGADYCFPVFEDSTMVISQDGKIFIGKIYKSS